MKSGFTYLTFSVLLLICYFEKKSAAVTAASRQVEKKDKARFFIGRMAGYADQTQSSSVKMELSIADEIVIGSYCRADSAVEVDLIGSVNGENELFMTESANGKTTGTFKGILENRRNRLLKLSGVWTDPDERTRLQFSVEEVREYPTERVFAPATGKKLKMVALR